MPTDKISINRAPVLTLWATVVAERLGYKHAEALTLGKAVSGLNAQSKGQRLGIYQPTESKGEKREKPKSRKETDEFSVMLMGRAVPAVESENGIRATTKGSPIHPEAVQSYLERKFKDDLAPTTQAMKQLAAAYKPKELASKAYSLYEKFRPEIPEGNRGWGATGELDLNHIRHLAKESPEQ